jgi:uncharacterized repeat protein (TIGR01451 family)
MAEHRVLRGIRPRIIAAMGAICLLAPLAPGGRALAAPVVEPADIGFGGQAVAEAGAIAPVSPAVARAAQQGMTEFLVLLERPDGASADVVLAAFSGTQRATAATLDERAEARLAAHHALAAEAAPRFRALDATIEPLIASGSIVEFERFLAFGVLAVTGDSTSVQTIAGRPGVAAVLPNRRHRLDRATAPAVPTIAGAWNLEMVGAERAWREVGANGQGVVVATIDSGADWSHPALRTRYRGRDGRHDYDWMDFSRPSQPRERPADGNGHGTQVLGAAVGRSGAGPMGVAPGAEWIAVRAFDSYGFSTDRQLLRAAQWLLAPTRLDGTAPRPDLAPDIVNCSWVLENGADPLFDAVVGAWRSAGILSVFAAGNSDDGTRTWAGILAPASHPDVLAVGALRPSGEVWELSKGGPSFHGGVKPDLVAPGVGVRTARDGGGTSYGTGTSIAAPHVAGTAALMLSANPGLGVDDLAYGLRSSARDLGAPGPDNESGWGGLDALRAAEWAMSTGRVAGRIADLGGAPIAGAAIRLEPDGSGGFPAVTTIAGVDGTFSVAVGPGAWTVTVSSLRHVPESAKVHVAGELTSMLDLHLAPAPLGAVSGRVVGVFDQPLGGARVELVGSAAAGSVGSDGAAVFASDEGAYELKLPEGTHELRYSAAGHRAITTAVEVAPGVESPHNVLLSRVPRLLLVDADAYTGERVHPYFGRALRTRGYEFDIWTIDDPLSDVPDADDLAPYDVVVWLHVYGSPGRIDARGHNGETAAALTSYVSRGGRLIISGQDIGRHDSDDVPLAGAEAPELFRNLLGARFVEDHAGLAEVIGTGWLDGLSLDLDRPRGHAKGGRLSPDVVAPALDTGDATCEPVLLYPDGRAAGLALDSATGRRVYLAFGPEGVGDPDGLGSLYDKLIGWLESPWLSLTAEPESAGPGGDVRLSVALRTGRSAMPGELDVRVPPAWSIESYPDEMERLASDQVRWKGDFEAESSRAFDIGVRLTGPAAGSQAQVVTATLQSLGSTQVVTTALRAVVPDFEPSEASVAPGRAIGPGTVEYRLAIVNGGPADAAHAAAQVLLPAGARAVTETLEASSGTISWDPGGGRAMWHGVVGTGERTDLRLVAELPGEPGRSHVFVAEVGDGLSTVVTRTATALVGGPDLSGSKVLELPATVLAGSPFDLALRLDNRGVLPALVTTSISLPPGIDPPADAGGVTVSDDGRLLERQDSLGSGVSRVITVPLAIGAEALSGRRVIAISLDDGAAPASLVRLEASTMVRRAELDGSRTILLPTRVRSGDTMTATVFVSNLGDATVPVEVVDSLPPMLVASPDSVQVSRGQVHVTPGTVSCRSIPAQAHVALWTWGSDSRSTPTSTRRLG